MSSSATPSAAPTTPKPTSWCAARPKPRSPPASSPIICVGETEAERRGGIADAVVATQLEGSVPDQWAEFGIVIAYEPVWAIGTGLTPTIADIAQMHDGIRALLLERFGDRGEAVQLLYGGSMKPANAARDPQGAKRQWRARRRRKPLGK